MAELGMPKISKISKMDPAKQLKMWIDGKCLPITNYRLDKRFCKPNFKQVFTESINLPESNDTYAYELVSPETALLSSNFKLPSLYYAKLHNLPHFNIRNLEKATNTQISVPKYGKEGKIIITGDNKQSIFTARHHLNSLAGLIRNGCVPAQFIAIPVHCEEVKQNFIKFKNDILNDEPIEGMDESIFQKPEKLHLTVVVFTLLDEAEKNEAIKALQDCKTQIIDPVISKTGPLRIQVSGIDCMNDNYEKVNVLYANAKLAEESEDDCLQKIADSISDHFFERGLVKQYQDSVKLHVTLINTKYRKVTPEPSPTKKRSKWSYKRLPFDARTIMEKYKDYQFGESSFDSIHLSLMTSIGEDGFYKSLGVIECK